MALALYRKYRPAAFAEVVGQDHVTAPLQHALRSGRINHAYLFSGPRGCGKTSSARILARSLNCVDGPTDTPCGRCDSCVALAPDGPGSIDVIEIDAASHGGVDDARDLRERAFFAPVSSRYKVYIIDEAHMVTTQGFNALLKVVEEPPDFVVFVFATTEPEKLLATIRSRTHHYPFRLLPPGTMRALIEKLCAAEAVAIEPTVLPLVIRAGGGSARDALSVLDQLFAGAGDEGVTYAHAVGLLGMTDVALIDDLIDALGAGDGATVFETVDRVVEAGHDPRRFAGDLLDRLRDLVLLDAVPDATDKGLVDVPGEQLERMSAQAAQLGTASLSRLADVVHEGLADMRGTTSPRLVLELLCARMLLPAASSDAAAVLQRVERLERRQSIATPSRPEAAGAAASPESTVPRPPRRTPEAAPDPAASRVPVEPSASEAAAPAELGPSTERPAPTAASAGPPTSVASAEGGDIDAAAVRRVWPEVMQRVKVSSRRTHALMHNAAVSTVDGQELILVAESVPLARMLGEESNVEMIAAALREILGVAWRVRVVPQGAEPAARAAAAAPSEPVATTTPDEPAPDATPSASTGEPDPRDDTPDDREDAAPAARADPDEAALTLLKDNLGAETVE